MVNNLETNRKIEILSKELEHRKKQVKIYKNESAIVK